MIRQTKEEQDRELYEVYLDGVYEDRLLKAESEEEFDRINAQWDLAIFLHRGGRKN